MTAIMACLLIHISIFCNYNHECMYEMEDCVFDGEQFSFCVELLHNEQHENVCVDEMGEI